MRIEKHPAQPIAKQNVPDASRVLQRISLPLFYHKGRGFTYKASFFIKKSNLRKERGKNHEFFYNSSNRIKTVVTAIGAGVAVWGVINLLEGYGNDNPGAKSQGIKQLMAGRRHCHCGADGDSTAHFPFLIIHGSDH